jgi:hypothetical protein
MGWLGNGMTLGQVEDTKTTGYLDTVDKPKPIKKDCTTTTTPIQPFEGLPV